MGIIARALRHFKNLLDVSGTPSTGQSYVWNPSAAQWETKDASHVWHFANTTAMNALPSQYRRTGLLGVNNGDNITYQLDDNDTWQVFSALNPYTIPQFTQFSITGQGAIVVNGATLSGSQTFTWSTSPSSNVATNSLSIRDVTANVTLASSLADDSSQTITLPTTITFSTGDSHVWRIAGTDTHGNTFQSDYTVSCVAASDATRYVRTDGSDSNTGTADNAGGAYLTTQKAADMSGVGDHTIVRTGTYDGFTLGWDASQSGAAGHLIRFQGDSATINHRNIHGFDAVDIEACSFVQTDHFAVTNDGTVTKAGIRQSGGGSGNVIDSNTVTGTGRFGIITGFLTNSQITNNTVVGVLAGGGQNTGHGIYSANAGDTITISGNVVHGCGGDGIHTNGDATQGGSGVQTGLTIARNTLYDNNTLEGGGGINCDGILDSRIENNLIYKEHSAGIALYAQDASFPSTGNTIVNNTVLVAVDSPKHCLRFANGSAGNTVFNNILYNANSTGCAIACDADSIPVSDYNLVSNRFSVDGGTTILTLAQWQSATGQDTHSTLITSLDSIFNSPSADDYTLKTSGAAINNGAATFNGKSAPTTDILSAARPFATSYDIGCYESQIAGVVVSSVSPTGGSSGVSTSSTVTFTFDRDVVSGSIVFALNDGASDVAGSLSYDSGSHTATFTPTSLLVAGTTYTATISAADSVTGGLTLVDPYVWSFSALGTHQLFGSGYTPPTSDGGDPTNLTLGLHFYSNVDASLTKVMFYKDTTNTGTHVAKVWDASGNLLATKTFSGETSSGKQTAVLDTPVSLTANTRYFASVWMPSGHYSFDNTIHTKSNSPLFTADVLVSGLHPSCFASGDAWPGGGTPNDNFYGIDVEIAS